MLKNSIKYSVASRVGIYSINIPLPRATGVWIYSLRSLKSKIATAINLIRKIGFNRSKPLVFIS